MANYYSPIVIQQTIPLIDITTLELLCLKHMFESAEADGQIYFYASETLHDVISVDRDELAAALTAPENAGYADLEEFREPLNQPQEGDPFVSIDLSMLSWEPFVQKIVQRSATLEYVSAMISYNCTKMRADGFGGMAVLITADAISTKDTNEILDEMLEEAGITVD